MPASKLKNLAILVLLLANLVLASVLIPRQLESRQQQTALGQSLAQFCADQNVSLNPDILPNYATLYALELSAEEASDRQIAAALLGETLDLQQGSTRYRQVYTAEAGQCTIYSAGDFHAQLLNQPEVIDRPAAAEKLLQKTGLSFSEPVVSDSNPDLITVTQTVLDAPVFTSNLTLTYTDDRLTALDGTVYTGALSLSRVSEAACCSAADALVAFLSQRYDLGWVGSSITAITQGYLRTEAATAAALQLSPVWQLTTDTETFYVNGLTQEIMPFH